MLDHKLKVSRLNAIERDGKSVHRGLYSVRVMSVVHSNNRYPKAAGPGCSDTMRFDVQVLQ